MSQESLVGRNLGSFEIVAELGKGGMGVVYRAYQSRLAREVAVKVLLPWLVSEPGYLDRFLVEARSAARLHHPNIVTIYDVGESEGHHYIVMELVTGRSLSQLVRERGLLTTDQVLRIARQVASALDHAHASGIIHRDVKPSNIMVGADDHVTLMDFGIARLDDGATRLTITGAVIGTPHYMAPEQVEGGTITNAVDRYAFGVVLFEMLAGRPPFQANTPVSVMMSHVSKPPPHISSLRPELPTGLDEVLVRALAKNPSERFPTCVQLVDAVTEALRPSAPSSATATLLPPDVARGSSPANQQLTGSRIERVEPGRELVGAPNSAPLTPTGARALSRRSLLMVAGGAIAASGAATVFALSRGGDTASPLAGTQARSTPAAPAPPSSPQTNLSPIAKPPTTGAPTPTAAAQQTAVPTTAPTAAAKPAASSKASGNVTVMALGSDAERDIFLAVIAPFEEQTGFKVQYEPTLQIQQDLDTRIRSGNPPEIASLPGPAKMVQYARAGTLLDLYGLLSPEKMREEYVADFATVTQVDGRQVAVAVKAALKGNIWYSPKQFLKHGLQIPKTWDELMGLSHKIAGTGVAPWSIGLESGVSSGWPGTDWVEDIVLRQSGAEVYDQWWQGKVKWTSPEIRGAWETWGNIVADPKMVFGSTDYMLSTNFGKAPSPLFSDPPQAFLHHQASFIAAFIPLHNPNLKPVEDFAFFAFPDVEPKFTGSVESVGDLFGVFKDTPQARALLQYLTTADAQAIWVNRGGGIATNKKVSLEAYPDQFSKQSAQILYEAKHIRFDASDLMPEAMSKAFLKAVLDYVKNPSYLDSILSSLDKTQAEAYR